MNRMETVLGPFTESVDQALIEAEQTQVVKRIWRKDSSLWSTDESGKDHQKLTWVAHRSG